MSLTRWLALRHLPTSASLMFARTVHHKQEKEFASMLTRPVPAGGRIPLMEQVSPSGIHWRSGRLPWGWAGERARGNDLIWSYKNASDGPWRSRDHPEGDYRGEDLSAACSTCSYLCLIVSVLHAAFLDCLASRELSPNGSCADFVWNHSRLFFKAKKKMLAFIKQCFFDK